jgi:hypothetical protein
VDAPLLLRTQLDPIGVKAPQTAALCVHDGDAIMSAWCDSAIQPLMLIARMLRSFSWG